MKYRNLRQRQRGVTLTETLLVLIVAATLAVAAYSAYSIARTDTTVADMSQSTVVLTEKIKQVWGMSNDYSDLTATSLNNAGILPKSFRYDNNDIRDPFGQIIDVSGGSSSFALAFRNLSKDTCSSIAPTLAGFSYRVTVGNGVSVDNGMAQGGIEFKNEMGDINTANMLAACGASSAAARSVAIEIR